MRAVGATGVWSHLGRHSAAGLGTSLSQHPSLNCLTSSFISCCRWIPPTLCAAKVSRKSRPCECLPTLHPEPSQAVSYAERGPEKRNHLSTQSDTVAEGGNFLTASFASSFTSVEA